MKKVLYIALASTIAFYAGQASATTPDGKPCPKNISRYSKSNPQKIAKAAPKSRVNEAFRGKSS